MKSTLNNIYSIPLTLLILCHGHAEASVLSSSDSEDIETRHSVVYESQTPRSLNLRQNEIVVDSSDVDLTSDQHVVNQGLPFDPKIKTEVSDVKSDESLSSVYYNEAQDQCAPVIKFLKKRADLMIAEKKLDQMTEKKLRESLGVTIKKIISKVHNSNLKRKALMNKIARAGREQALKDFKHIYVSDIENSKKFLQIRQVKGSAP
jgi:hypothetical protein